MLRQRSGDADGSRPACNTERICCTFWMLEFCALKSSAAIAASAALKCRTMVSYAMTSTRAGLAAVRWLAV